MTLGWWLPWRIIGVQLCQTNSCELEHCSIGRCEDSTCSVEKHEGLIRREEHSGLLVKTGLSLGARRGVATVV